MFRRFSSLNATNYQSGNSGYPRAQGNYSRGGYYGNTYQNPRGNFPNGYTQNAQYFRSQGSYNTPYQGYQPRFNQPFLNQSQRFNNPNNSFSGSAD